jgi:hypothetical protein
MHDQTPEPAHHQEAARYWESALLLLAPAAQPGFPALTAAASPTATRCGSRKASVRLAEQVPGDAGEVGAHRRHSDVRVA